MKTWFDKNRVEILNRVCVNMLRHELCKGLSIKELNEIIDTIETFNKGDLAKTGGTSFASHDIDLSSEILQAISAEVVSVEDNKFINKLYNGASKTHEIDLDKIKKGGYIGDRLAVVSEKIKEIYKILDTGKPFILCPPVELCLLQSANDSVFSPDVEGSFKGPNNTMLVGALDKVPVYTYIPNISAETDNWETGEYLVGIYYEKEDRCLAHRLVVNNMSFV